MSPAVGRFISTLLPLIDEFYADFETYLCSYWDSRCHFFPLTDLQPEERQRRGAEIIERLQQQMPIAEIISAAPEIICAPDEAKTLLQEIDSEPKGSARERFFYHIVRTGLLQEMAVRVVLAGPTNEAVQFIVSKVRSLMRTAFDGGPLYYDYESHDYFHKRTLPDYWFLLAALMPHPVATEFMRDLITGVLQLTPPVDANLNNRFIGFVQNSSYTRRALLKELYKHDLLDLDLFSSVARYEPDNVVFRNEASLYEPETFEFAMTAHNSNWSRQVAENFKPEDIGFAMRNFFWIKGAFFLLKSCEHTERLGLKKLLPLDYRHCAEAALGRMAHIRDWKEEDNEEETLAQLRQFKTATLQTVLPVAGVGQELVLRALGKENLLPLLHLIYSISGYRPRQEQYQYRTYDVQNGSDAASGVLDLSLVRAALREAGETDAQMLLGGLRQSKIGLDNTVMLLEAVSGWNEADIEKKLGKRHQTAVKAFGLLPLLKEDREVEALERYLWLRRFARESKQFGSQRRASEAAAVSVALANLAQIAGYADVTQLEWAMEARLAQGGSAEGAASRATVGDYEVEVAFEGDEAQLKISRGGKTIKTAPPAVRTSEDYARLKELQAQLKSQRTRFRATLENMMAEERALSQEEIARLASLPAARPLLLKLIWRNEEGRFGRFDDTFSQLRAVDGQSWPAQSALRLAHPFDLFGAGQLAEWQRALVQQRIVQPFRQAFRELYVLTPAERTTRTFSNRFAGHVVEPRRAARLLGGRGWRLDAEGEFSVPEKPFPAAGLRACFDFADIGHFFTELDQITSDAVYFMPLERPRYWNRREEDPRLPLENIPPKIFSEVMRDADLVISVAQLGEGGTLSGEAFERRGDVVRALIADLGLPGVEVDGHFAHVTGQLANYRVHLGSGVIHIEPGNYLCIVPERGTAREKLFLPFADEDAKMSEVVSKILLLLRDDKINDDTILRQIRAAHTLPS